MNDRRRGALIGLAVGDALGAAVEFKPPGTFATVTGYRGGGPHGLKAGEWTDDTSMALALADSIATAGWDLNDQARRYDIKGSGWVVKSLEASLWAFRDANSLEEAVLKAMNLGDDADTTGAICGQLAGAYWGESNIPEALRSGLARMDMLENALTRLVRA
jgi:ADP-ribosylglycohydrolase